MNVLSEMFEIGVPGDLARRNPYRYDWKLVQNWNGLEGWELRQELVRHYAWAIPSRHAVQRIRHYGPVVEIGAGTGYWAWMIQRQGGDVVAYDNHLLPNEQYCTRPAHWFPVSPGDHRDAGRHPDRTLFLCWPPYESSMAARSLRAHSKAGGRTVIYVGESWGGCTGDDDFHQMLRDRYSLIETVDIPRWPYVYDRMEVYRSA